MNQTQSRKSDHIRICTGKNVQSPKSTLLECVGLEKSDASEANCSTELFGKKLDYPIIIAGMTGGVVEAEKINRNLAKAAEQLGLGFGVGSQRAMLENSELKSTYEVRDVAPSILLFGNIGASQLSEYSPEQIGSAALDIGSDILAVHLNEIQEKLQPEGAWKKYSGQLEQLCSSLKLPVIVKETGMGISKETAEGLKGSGIAGIDVGGSGGTSFACVELERSGKTGVISQGIPTAASILEARKVFPKLPIIATGGIRSGEDIAKAIAIGADVAGIALPLLKPAQESTEAVLSALEKFITELKQAVPGTINDLKHSKPVITGELAKWI